MTHTASVQVSAADFTHWRNLLSITDCDEQPELKEQYQAEEDDNILIGSAVFDNGAVIDLHLVSGQHNYYVEPDVHIPGVTVSEENSEPCFDLDETMEFIVKDDSYLVCFILS